jgi:hypothetical protein
VNFLTKLQLFLNISNSPFSRHRDKSKLISPINLYGPIGLISPIVLFDLLAEEGLNASEDVGGSETKFLVENFVGC